MSNISKVVQRPDIVGNQLETYLVNEFRNLKGRIIYN